MTKRRPAAVPPAPTFEPMTIDAAAHRLRMIADDIDRVVVAYRALDAIDRDTLQAAYTAILVVTRNLDDLVSGRGQG